MQILSDNNSVNLPATPWKLCLSLFQGKYAPHELWEIRKFRNKFMLRSLVMPFSTHKLLKFITKHPSYEKILHAQPRLPCRLHRPYLTNRLSRHDGAAAIIYHYTMMHKILGTDAFNQHLDNRFHVAEFDVKNGDRYYLSFISVHRLDREGEASLILHDANGEMLCEITFTLCEREGKKALMIGGIQGPNSEDAQQKVQAATKNLHGIFPKKLVCESLIAIAKIFNVESIAAVSNETHVYQSLRYHNRQKRMHADYNSFWEMMGGTLSGEGYYALPCESSRKTIESIASKKRAEYRRRYDLLDDITLKMHAALRA